VAERYGIARVVVAPTGDDLDEAFGPVAAKFVGGLLRSKMRLGVSWGQTLAALIRHLRPGLVSNLSIAQLAGGVNDPTAGVQGNELVREVAELFPGSQVYYLHAPAIVGSVEARDVLLADRTIQAALDAGRHSELALVGIGQMDAASTLYRGRHVEPDDWDQLLRAEAVGNINTRFFDAAGAPVELLERRTMAVTWTDLAAIPTVVAVAVGRDRVDAIRGALATHCVDILITDETTARALVTGAQASRAAAQNGARVG
jgi:DNA-binding transcriptional regulator LsrR (DeoR family)